MDCKGWRLFDVAVNNEIKLKDVDIWNESGHDSVNKKVVTAESSEGVLRLHFPNIKANQAVISAIAIRRNI